MDITERKITKIAREAEKLVLLTMREEGVGTAEIDLIHAVRHHPGCTQAQLAELLHADKAAIARRTKNLEAKGLLIRRDAPSDRRSQLLYPTKKAESLRSSKAEIEAAFYEYLTNVLTAEEAAVFDLSLKRHIRKNTPVDKPRMNYSPAMPGWKRRFSSIVPRTMDWRRISP